MTKTGANNIKSMPNISQVHASLFEGIQQARNILSERMVRPDEVLLDTDEMGNIKWVQ